MIRNMNVAGLISNMVGVIIIGFQRYTIGFGGTSPAPELPWLYWLGWGCMFIGFSLMLASEIIKRLK